MNTNQPQASKQIQSNRHLKEWSDNSATEIKVRYVLDGKHKQETNCLLLEGGSVPERAALATRQTEELQELKDQNSETRTAIQERHRQEDADLKLVLSQESKSTVYQRRGSYLREPYL